MDPFAKSKPLNDEELTKLLTEMLVQALGEKAKGVNIEQIVGIAKEMLKDIKPEGISKKDIQNKNSEVVQDVGKTLVAATAASLLMTHQKDTLHQLLDRHKHLMEDRKGLKEGTKEHEENTKEINECKLGIKNVLKDINRMDPNPQRRDAFDKQLEKDEFFKELTNPADKELQTEMKKGANLTANQKDALTESLINLFGMDPRITGAGMSPVQSVVGNEMGIPDNYPAFTANEPLHALSDDIMTPNAASVEGTRASMMEVPDQGGVLETLCNEVEETFETVVSEHPELGHESPSLTRS
jgi:hypothetical protein